MKNSSIIEIKVSGQEITDIAQKIAAVLDDTVTPSTAYIACLFMATVLMNPEIPPDDIHRIIKDTSRYMHMLDNPNPEEPVVMN